MGPRPVEDLLYCRQFVLGDGRWETPAGWRTLSLGGLGTLAYHPALPCTTAARDDARLVCLGYAIDPGDPGRDTGRLLEDLLGRAPAPRDVARATASWAGRWVLIAQRAGAAVALHDAGGFRQLFYLADAGSPVWCASQAIRIAEALQLPPDPRAVEGLVQTAWYQHAAEPWWPGDRTRWHEVRALLPNHYLDLVSRRPVRFWPVAPLEPRVPEAGAEEAAARLRDLLNAAAARFELALPLTAGYDSRTLLAGLRDHARDLFCYTIRFGAAHQTQADITIPRSLLRALALPHTVIARARSVDPEFEATYRRNTDPWHAEACILAQGLYREYPRRRVSVSGHASEIARCAYRRHGFGPEVTASALAAASGMDPTAFVLEAFGAWMEEARPAWEATGLDGWDLFYWEQRVARWAANGQSQWDLVHERFTPFACRAVQEPLLAIPREPHRVPPAYAAYRRMMTILWPEVLALPFNPPARRSLARRWWDRLRRA